ncbi:MAG: hypothetical protein H6622_10430 [Halobacteriovoraceae bacterium]|nr:hypothetical protein [Halobacteriovoraceae bacterium]
MVPLIHDDGKDLKRNIWVEGIWGEQVVSIFDNEIIETIAKAHRALEESRKLIMKRKGLNETETTVGEWENTVNAYQSMRYPIRGLSKSESCFLVDGEPVCATIIDYVISSKKGHKVTIDESKLDELEREWFGKLDKVCA